MKGLEKSIFLAASLFCMTQFFGGCKKDNKNVTAAENQNTTIEYTESVTTEKPNTILMRIGHAQTEVSPRHRSLLLFKEQVESLSEGKITVEIYPNGELGDETEMTVAVSDGKLEAVRGGDLDFVPKSMLLGLPMIADNLADARKLCYSDFVKNMLSDARESNMLVLAVGDDSGFRQITNSVRPIKRPADMKGLKIRAPQIVATVNFIKELGAQPQVIPFTELYTRLFEKKVDGQENPLALIDSSKFYEVQKYCTILDYQFFPELMYVNLSWWTSLSSEHQKILSDCARKMMDQNAYITDSENEAYIRHIQEENCEVITLTASERAQFLPYAERVWEKYIDDGLATKQELTEMLFIVGKTVDW